MRGLGRRGVRRVAVLTAAVLVVSLVSPGQALTKPGVNPFPLSWLWSWLPAPAGWAAPPSPHGPQQESGTAAGKGHYVPSTATQAGKGSGHAPGKGAGQLDSYQPHVDLPKPVTAPATPGEHSFDPARSKRLAAAATATSDVYQNADGSYTRKVYGAPVNYQAADGSWKPIDTSLARTGDGRWHQKANSQAVDFAGSADDPALVSVGMDPAHSVSYGLAGAAKVGATVAGTTLTYTGVFPGTDLVTGSRATATDQRFVLHSAGAATSWVFPLHLRGATPRANADGSVDFIDASGAVVQTISAALMTDSSVDGASGEGASSRAVTYRLTTTAGQPALTVSVDPTWLNDPARVFPVRVDFALDAAGDTSRSADTAFSADKPGSRLLKVGTYNGGATKANSFLWFSDYGSTFNGVPIQVASLHVFDVWAPTCTPEPFTVSPVTQPRPAAGVSAYPGPSFDRPIGSVSAPPGPACSNTKLDPAVGTWMSVPLSVDKMPSSSSSAGRGLALTASQSDSAQWKQLASTGTANQPYLAVTYAAAAAAAPVITAQYPPQNGSVATLAPELVATASPGSSLQYDFWLFDLTGKQLGTSNLLSTGAWKVPPGTLVWGKDYAWEAAAYNGSVWSPLAGPFWFTTTVPQPPVTSRLSQNNGGHGFDPSVGNYTTQATDAQVASPGPALSVVRSYNSADPTQGSALGAGWSSVFDARATEQHDSSGAVQTVVVTYPDGQQVAYGRNADGSFTPPLGRYATFAVVSGGGYSLTDKNSTVYRFTQLLSSGVYGITSITDSAGRALVFSYMPGGTVGSGPFLTSVTSSSSGRMLHLAWDSHLSALNIPRRWPSHISSISTDPAVAGNPSTALTWNYSYTGDQLTQVCPPTSAAACTRYSYTAATHYPTTAVDLQPRSYWRLNETGSATVAASSVLANEQSDAGIYSNVALGQPGELPGATATAAGFNGSSSFVDLTAGAVAKAVVTNSSYQSIGLWFKTTTANGVLFAYQDEAVHSGTTGLGYVPALYVGSDGKLQGLFWCGCGAPVASSAPVTDGRWHHVVLAGGGDTQSLYLDGALVGSRSGTIQIYSSAYGGRVSAIGAGYLGGQWPDQPHYSTSNNTGYATYFSGSIADVAFFDRWLSKDNVAELYGAGVTQAQLLSGITTPLGKTATTVSYDGGSDRVTQVTDHSGGTWKLGAPTVSGTSQVYVSSVLASTPTDYWRLGDGDTPAVNQIRGRLAGYSSVTLGAKGVFDDNSGASFDGSSSSLSLPDQMMPGSGGMSTELWFNTTKAGAVLLSEQAQAMGGNACPCLPALWIGPDGTLRGTSVSDIPTGPLTGMGNKCLDLAAFGTGLSTKVQLFDCTGAWNQVWQPWPDGTLRNPGSGRCLDIAGLATTRGTKVQLWDCTGAWNQVWQPQADGSWKNPQSGMCLDLDGPSTANETQAWIEPCYSGAGQKWHASFASASPVNDGKWHQAVLSSDGTNQAMYLDGALVGKSAGPTLTSTPQPYTYAGAGHTSAGTGTAWNGLPAGADAYFAGTLDEVSFYTHGLSDEDVHAHFAAVKSSGGITPTQAVTVTDPDGHAITYNHDPSHGNRLIKQTDALGNTTYLGYDTGGFLNTVTDPNGVITTTGHDVRGNTVSRTTCQYQAASLCGTTYYTYYPDDTSKTLAPDPRNDLLLTVRDARSSSTTDNTYLTSYTYDAMGNRTGVTTPAVSGYPSGRTTTTAYTDGSTTAAVDSGAAPPGLASTVTTPGGAMQSTRYFHNGDIAQTTDAVGLVTRFGYDNLGRITSKTVVSDAYPAGLTTSLTYDGLDRATSVTNPPVTNRVTGAVHTGRTTTVYDPDGNVSSITVADLTGGDASRTTTTTYDAFDQPVTVTDPVGAVTTYGYDRYGNRTSTTDPSGTETDQAYDPNRQVLTTTLKGYTGDPANAGNPVDLVLSSRSYDPAGRLASVTDSMGRVTSYTYTDDGFMITATRSDPADPGTSFQLEANDYDAAGNLDSRFSNNGATRTYYTIDAAGRTTAALTDPYGVNRSVANTYSADDAVLSETISDGGGARAVTDATYDPLGRMLSQSAHDPTTSPVGRWRLNDGSGATAADSDGNHPAATSGRTGWSTDHGGSATFTASGALSTAGPVVDTSGSFTVSAWVYLSSNSTDRIAVAQAGARESAFSLSYEATSNQWAFSRSSDDTATPTANYTAASTTTPQLNTWTHLTGVYDAATHGLALYVNGGAEGTTSDPTPFTATGPFTIGRGMYGGNACCEWAGSISDVQVYGQALAADQVNAVYAGALPSADSVRSTSSRTLDQRGLPTAVTDPNGNVTSYAYDEAGRQTVATLPTVSTETSGGTAVAAHPVSMVGYDTFGATVEASDADGNVTTTARDADGRPTSMTAPSYTPPGSSSPITPVSTRTYNNLGQLATATDPLGHHTTYTYDQLGHVATTTAPNGGVTHTTYDTNGDPLSVTDPNGAVTQTTYDFLSRTATSTQVVRQPNPAAYTTTYAYDTPGGWLSARTSAAGATTRYGYDNLGETASVTDGAGNTTRYSYDYAGRQVTTLLPDGTAGTVAFDAVGRQTGTAQLDSNGSVLATTSAGYDRAGQMTSATDPRGNTTRFSFDAAGRQTSEVQPVTATKSITTTFGYDAAGNRTRFTDGRGNPFITTYNTWNLPESQIEPATPAYPNLADRTFTTGYDANGRPRTQTSPGGVSLTNTYDDIGNVTGQTGSGADAATADRTFGYDTAGRMTSASAPGGTDTFSYDDRGLLLTTTGPSGGSSFGYTPDGLMASRTDAAGTAGYVYDNADRLKTAQDPVTGTTLTYGYNTLSELATITYGTGDVRSFGYDHRHRLTSDILSTPSSATVASIGYGYDADGNETSKNTAGFAGSAANTYTYDYANRLTSWSTATGSTTYGYDDSGNRTSAGSLSFAYDARNELTSGAGSTYAYSARGTLAAVTTSGSSVKSTSDAYGQAITQGAQTYSYDAMGRAVTVATSGGPTTTLTYSGTGNNVAADGTATYSRGPGADLLGIGTATGKALTWVDLHDDVVGAFVSGSTALVGSRTYGPLGTVVASSNLPGNLGYQSGWTDNSTGRVNMAARWYNPNTGQFDNRDTVANNAVPNPVAANRYAYAGDNPLTNVDPDGHRFINQDDNGTIYAVMPSTNGGNDVAWGASNTKDRNIAYQKPTQSNWRPPVHKTPPPPPRVHVAVVRPQDCDDSLCRRDLAQSIADTQRLAEQQMDAALRGCRSERCQQQVYENDKYDWVDRGDGTYVSTDGGALVVLTDDNRVAAVAAAKKADDEKHAKAEACSKSFWCRAKQWAEDHASLVGAIAGAVVGAIVGVACAAASAGTLTLGCAVLAGAIGGAVSGAVSHGLDVAAGRANGGLGGWVTSIGVGAAVGAIGGAVGFGVGGLVGGSLARAGAGVFQRAAAGTVEGAVAGTATGAVTGAAGYGIGCASGASCTTAGLASAVGSGAVSGAVGGAVGGAMGGLKSTCESFDARTPVLLANGQSEPIADVRLGDKVLATDPATGSTAARTVTQLHLNQDRDLADLSVRDRDGHISTMATTQHHPFWDDTTHTWTDAGALHPGDRLRTADGGHATVVAVRSFIGSQPMYNLTVDTNHTYYVIAGNTPVLVHNCGTTDLHRVSPTERGTSELDHGLNPEHFPSVGPDGEELTGAAHFGNGPRVNDFASSHAGTHGQGLKVTVPNKWLNDNNIEIWEGRTPDQLEYLIPRDLMDEFNQFPRVPWTPGKPS